MDSNVGDHAGRTGSANLELDSFLAELRAAEANRAKLQSVETRSLPTSPNGYRILREIHRGGQGIVYATERVESGACVALKVLSERTALGSRARYRFEREVELVGSLHHPGIVSLLDSGVMPDGRLFLVMELIEGEEIGDHVRPFSGQAPRLELVEILDLFLQVGAALEYAHRHRVVHRDLKTQNVLVDSNGIARLLDFGVAKVLTEKGGTSAQLTATGEFVGSIAWAAPEQLNGTSDVDTRTDVYSLGLLLYFLLTGHMPYSLEQSVSELVAAIVGRPPAPMMNQPGAVRIPRDLEAIALRALEKEPGARYASIAEFSADVRRFLVGAPVQAREHDLRYVLGRFVLRNKVAAVAVGLLIGFLAFVGWQREVRARELAGERSRGRVDEGRLWGSMGRVPEAEDRLWRELLEPPPGEARPISNQPATWALRSIYSRYPCLTTKAIGPGRILGASNTLLLFLPESASKTYMQLFALPDLEPFGAPLLLPEGALLDRAQLSPTDDRIVVLLADGRVMLRATNGSSDWEIIPDFLQRCLYWVDDDRFLSVGIDGVVWSWRASSPGDRANVYQADEEPNQAIYSLGAARDGRRIQFIIKLLDHPQKFRNLVVDVDTGRVVHDVEGRVDLMSRDGRSYIKPGRSLAIYRLPPVGEPGDASGPFQRDASTFGYAVNHPFQNLIAWSGGPAKSIELLDLGSRTVQRTLSGHRHRVATMAFAGESGMLVSIDVSGVAKVWLTERSAQRVSLGEASQANYRGISTDAAGRFLGCAQQDPSLITVWDLKEGACRAALGGFEGRVIAVDVHPQGNHLVASTCNAGGVYLDDWRGELPVRRIGSHGGVATAVGFSPARRELATIGSQELVFWDLNGVELERFAVPHSGVRFSSLEWDSSGEWIALGQTRGGRSSQLVWFRRSTLTFELAPVGPKIRSISYSPPLDRFAVGDDDGRISIWRPGASSPEFSTEPLTGEVDGVSFDEAGELLAGTGAFGEVAVFDARSGQLLIEYPADDRSIVDLEFLPGGRMVTASRLLELNPADESVEPAELLVWDLSATDASLQGNLAYQVERLTEEYGRLPTEFEAVSSWVRSLDSVRHITRR